MNNNKLITLGMTPTRPETGYGYINYINTSFIHGNVSQVLNFVEKPSIDKAIEYITSGNYAWNVGIFIWTAETILNQLKQFAPTIECFYDCEFTLFDITENIKVIEKGCFSINYSLKEVRSV